MASFLSHVAGKLGVANQLRYLRARSSRGRYRDYLDTQHMRLLFAFVLYEESNCVDIGAHTGVTLREMLRYAPNGRHYAFEPIPYLYERLREEFPGVIVRREAISSSNGSARFQYVRNAPAYSGLLARTYPTTAEVEDIVVPVTRLDDVLPPDYQLDLLKIDVEGSEHHVLAGAEHVIQRCRPVVIFEHGLGGQAPPSEVYDFFKRVDFRIFDIDGNGPYDKSGFIREYRLNRRWNWVAHS
jgi:FkbM family methyltransferase